MTQEKSKRLGRGLEALLGAAAAPDLSGTRDHRELQRIPIGQIRPNPFQPRREFPADELEELSASLRVSGMLQPVVVRAAQIGFELISGERRLRAALQLGWTDVPALIRSADEKTMLTLALIENLQRTDLNSIEEAHGYRQLRDEFNLTHEDIAAAVGKDRSTITNLLRLLSLPNDVQQLLQQGRITTGHARALLSLSDPAAVKHLAKAIASEDLSVRETERRIREQKAGPTEVTASRTNDSQPLAGAPSVASGEAKSPALKLYESRLRAWLQTDVHIIASGPGDRGRIELRFYSQDDLGRILDKMLGTQALGD